VIGLPAGAVGTVVGQTFYAFQNTRIPILAGLLDVALFVILGTLLVPHWGLAALPVSFVTSLYTTSLLVTHPLARLTGFPVLPLFLRPFMQSLIAALVALGAGLVLEGVLGGFLPGSYPRSVLCLGVACAVYLAIQHFVFRSPETARILRYLPFLSPTRG
jgi:peptidoglycan biosynthesis protein MviN/MurJ (putative lipid II flippase)